MIPNLGKISDNLDFVKKIWKIMISLKNDRNILIWVKVYETIPILV